MKTLFDVTNRALGKSANSMTQGDFKTIKDDKVPSDDADNADSSEEKKDVSEKLDRTMFLKITVK